MATFFVSKSGNDSNNGLSSGTALLTIGQAIAYVNTAIGMGATTNTITIGDGTYTETVTYSNSNLTITSTSEDRTAVIIAQSSGSTIKLAKGSTSNVFKHLTIQNTDDDTNDNGIYGANGGSGSKASFTVEDCIFDCQSTAIQYAHGCTIKRTKFLVNGGDNGSNVYAIKNGTGASDAVFNIEACLFVGWDKWTINGSGGYCIVRNCTLVLDASDQSTSYLMYWSGTNVEVYNSIFYGGASSVDFGLRFQSANSANKAKNNIAFGAIGTPYTNTGSPTVSAQLETNTEVAASSQTVFTALGDADIDDDYTINTSGIAYQRGLAAELGSDGKDVDGNDFDDSNPNIGCYTTVASGWSAGSNLSGLAVGSISTVLGVARASISKIIGV
ncbi:MAG: hypothetical protein CMH30_00010 [Micavibrio sp.]|nr:hypothetical protein [Micavibrio sp.]